MAVGALCVMLWLLAVPVDGSTTKCEAPAVESSSSLLQKNSAETSVMAHIEDMAGTHTSWNEWRWGNAEGMEAQSLQNRQSGILLETEVQVSHGGTPLEKLSPEDPSVFVKCTKLAHASVPASIKFDETLDNETAYYSASLADHIYFLCVHCDRTFPSSWKGKVTYVSGIGVDDCLGIQDSKDKDKIHSERVTRAHKLIVLAAKFQKFRKILVLEEDAVLAQPNGLRAANSQALMKFIESGEWDLLRLGYIARNVFLQTEQAQQCKHNCVCAAEASCGDVCTTAEPGCDIRSSVAYMIKDSRFEDFLAARGCIDTALLASFKQSFMVPPLFHQGGKKLLLGMQLDDKFEASCVHGWV